MTDSVQDASPKARPILMSAPMVRALLGARKTQTRRVMKPQPVLHKTSSGGYWCYPPCAWTAQAPHCPLGDMNLPIDYCPYGKPGDLLWVRESFYQRGESWRSEDETGERDVGWNGFKEVKFAATDDIVPLLGYRPGEPNWRSKPSIHMPRWASRLTLELTEVRVERLCDISEADAIAEGIEPMPGVEYGFLNYTHIGAGTGYYTNREGKTEGAAHSSYISLWESINGNLSDQIGPWVWCLSFRVHRQNVDELLGRKAA